MSALERDNFCFWITESLIAQEKSAVGRKKVTNGVSACLVATVLHVVG